MRAECRHNVVGVQDIMRYMGDITSRDTRAVVATRVLSAGLESEGLRCGVLVLWLVVPCDDVTSVATSSILVC